MDWNAEIEKDREALKRIVALLFALAGLAARASSLPRPVGGLVLWILRRAEAVAREFVTGRAPHRGALPARTYPTASMDGVNADAARLALCFRALALSLATTLARARPFAQLHAPSNTRTTMSCFCRQKLSWPRRGFRTPAPDTS